MTYLISCWAIHNNSRSNRQWWNGQNCYYHPVRSSKLGIHSQDITFFICYMPENLPHSFSTQTYFLLLRIFVHMFPFSCQVKSSSSDVWLISTTASMPLFAWLINKSLKSHTMCQSESMTHYVTLAGVSMVLLPWCLRWIFLMTATPLPRTVHNRVSVNYPHCYSILLHFKRPIFCASLN